MRAIKFFDAVRYDLYCFAVMHDHVHTLVRVFPEYKLEQIMHSWKSYCSRELRLHFGRHGELWQREYYDRIVRDENEFAEKLNYILTNPVRKYENSEHYEWVGSR